MADSAPESFSDALMKPLTGGENPITAMMLGLCSAMAVTTNLMNGIAMGLGVVFVMWSCNTVISLLRHVIPKDVRVPAYITVIATSVTIVDLTMAAYMPAVHAQMGIFLALIVVNCIVLARAEAYASRNSVIPAMGDGIGMGLGYALILCFLGASREVLGASALFGVPLVEYAGMVSGGLKTGIESMATAMDYQPSILMVLPPGSFLLIGLLMAAIRVAWQKKLAGE